LSHFYLNSTPLPTRPLTSNAIDSDFYSSNHHFPHPLRFHLAYYYYRLSSPSCYCYHYLLHYDADPFDFHHPSYSHPYAYAPPVPSPPYVVPPPHPLPYHE